MKIAALDLGTNSFLCLICEVSSSGKFTVLHDEMKIVRLGQELGKTGRIHEGALKRAQDCLKNFADLIQKFRVTKIQAVATAAAREASNAQEFLKICESFKIPIVTLSGEEEALMSFRGTLSADENEKVLLIDIGGGSTEYTVGSRDKIEFAQSLPYGAVKLTEKFISRQPVSLEEENKLRGFIQLRTEELWAQVESLSPQKIIAVAGTPTSLAASHLGGYDASKVEGFILSHEDLQSWVKKLGRSTVEEKRSMGFGDRSDVIFSGTIILDELLKRLPQKEIVVSTKGIRYGLAYKMAAVL